jgi:hypothetical protein
MHRQNRQRAGSGRQGQVMKVRGPVTMKEKGLGRMTTHPMPPRIWMAY